MGEKDGPMVADKSWGFIVPDPGYGPGLEIVSFDTQAHFGESPWKCYVTILLIIRVPTYQSRSRPIAVKQHDKPQRGSSQSYGIP